MKCSGSGVFLFIAATIALSGKLGAQDDTSSPEPRRNPYIELGSKFKFVHTGDPLVDWNSIRSWTASDGRKMRAKILGINDKGEGVFLLPNKRRVNLAVSRFSEDDQRFIAEWREVSKFFNLGYQKSRNVTNTVQAGINDGAFAKEGKVHETRNFRFVCDQPLNAITVKDFSRLFEATYAMVRALPLGLEVATPPEGKFLVRLFSDKNDYHAAGGPDRAAGVYILKDREILVPLESLGIKRSGRTFRKASEYDPSTLIHETTHAVTHQWLNYMPMWVAEGLADYVAAIPYKNGTFFLNEIDSGVYKMVSINFGGDALRFPILRPEEFVYLGKNEYMNRPSEPEKPIELTSIQPYQIRLAGSPENNAPSGGNGNSMPANQTAPTAPMTVTVTTPPIPTPITIPVRGPQVINQSAIVVQRYSSSMVLLHHLLNDGQAAGLRMYLFSHLDFEWDAEKYLADYYEALRQHETAVKKQIADFDQVLEDFNGSIRAYNDVVRKRNAGEDIPLLKLPEKPVIPGPVTVPEILSRPRSSDQFSRKVFRHRSAEKFLNLPANLQI